jgi:autoinducer 2 (AI-2) kinase
MSTGSEAVLALDVGTSSGRAAAIARDGMVQAIASRSWSLAPSAEGVGEFSATLAWEAIADAIREVCGRIRATGASITAVSSASVRGAIVILDGDGAPLWASGSLDARGAEHVEALRPHEPEFNARTGQLLAFAALPRIRWFEASRPQLAGRARRVVTVDGWLQRCLTGTDLASTTNASTTGLVDASRRDWLADGEQAEPWSIPDRWRDRLPPVAEAGSLVAGVTPEAARVTGLTAGIPVAVGGGDAQLAALGMGSRRAGDTAIVMGSHWQQVLVLDRLPEPDTRFRVICGPIPGTWHADGIAIAAGILLEDFVNLAVPPIADPGQDAPAEHDRAAVELAAGRLGPGSAGALAVSAGPIDRVPWTHVAPTLIDLPRTDALTARAAGYRALLESGSVVAARNLRTLSRATGVVIDRPIRVGGGVSRSDLACRVLSGVLGQPLLRGRSHESTLLGAAVCAGVAAGWYPSVAQGAAEVEGACHHIESEPGDHDAYRVLEVRWEAAFEAQLALVRAGITRPLVSLPD